MSLKEVGTDNENGSRPVMWSGAVLLGKCARLALEVLEHTADAGGDDCNDVEVRASVECHVSQLVSETETLDGRELAGLMLRVGAGVDGEVTNVSGEVVGRCGNNSLDGVRHGVSP
jgi:hypothetical protein